ncbi:MAG: hypothetical protein ACI9EM_000580 [Candidatus Thalassarchaeaceae archaeon]|jgi:hypothetical protein|tara:strand:- start:276 stop:512 length:237 start_codon:yes stop_codon:yes gene_type:complete
MMRNLNPLFPPSNGMPPIWPFKKKKSTSRLKGNKYTENIIEYERKNDTKTEEKINDKSHLKSKTFLDAMKIIDNSKKD